MALLVKCGKCGQTTPLDGPAVAGATVKCASCAADVEVPAAEASFEETRQISSEPFVMGDAGPDSQTDETRRIAKRGVADRAAESPTEEIPEELAAQRAEAE